MGEIVEMANENACFSSIVDGVGSVTNALKIEPHSRNAFVVIKVLIIAESRFGKQRFPRRHV